MAKSTTTTGVKNPLTEEETKAYLKIQGEIATAISPNEDKEKPHCIQNDKRYEEPFEDDGAYAD